MKGYDITLEKKLTISSEDMTDIIVTALEGGIGYWAGLDNRPQRFAEAPEDEPVSETTAKILLEGGKVTFYDVEDPSERWDLDEEKLVKGIRMFLETDEGSACIEDGKLDPCYVDSSAADTIIQYALFDELVYG